MAEVVREKSHGIKFAEQQLLRHGWEQGKGLGRAENGISEAIKVKVKCDKGGVGHKEGEQFTFHWWDHVFNKASSSLQVESDRNGIQLKKTTEEDEENEMVSNKRPRRAALAKAKLYGSFVKSATLLSGQEQPEPKCSNSDDSSSSSDEEDDQKLDLSSTTKLSDADLMKVCGGRTAHKGARHGLTMSAKLARLEQQEAEFMAKYGKKSQRGPSSPSPLMSQLPDQRSESQEEPADDAQRGKIKKKRSTRSINEHNDVSESPETDVKPKKKKKKTSNAVFTEDDVMCVDHSRKTKGKRKKKNKAEERAPSPEETMELQTDKVKKKKKKLSKHHSEEEQSPLRESELVQDCDPETQTSRAVSLEEAQVRDEVSKTVKQKLSADNSVGEEALCSKKKKSKK